MINDMLTLCLYLLAFAFCLCAAEGAGYLWDRFQAWLWAHRRKKRIMRGIRNWS